MKELYGQQTGRSITLDIIRETYLTTTEETADTYKAGTNSDVSQNQVWGWCYRS